MEGIKKYMSSLSRRPGDDPVKRARAIWKLRAFKFDMAVAMNFFIPNVEEFFETILSFVQPKRNHRLSLLYLCRIHSPRCYGSKGFPVSPTTAFARS